MDDSEVRGMDDKCKSFNLLLQQAVFYHQI